MRQCNKQKFYWFVNTYMLVIVVTFLLAWGMLNNIDIHFIVFWCKKKNHHHYMITIIIIVIFKLPGRRWTSTKRLNLGGGQSLYWLGGAEKLEFIEKWVENFLHSIQLSKRTPTFWKIRKFWSTASYCKQRLKRKFYFLFVRRGGSDDRPTVTRPMSDSLQRKENKKFITK